MSSNLGISGLPQTSGGQLNTATIPVLPAGATFICKSNAVNGSSTSDIYTVTAAKTLYILGVYVSVSQLAATSSNGRIQADIYGTGSYQTLVTATVTASATAPQAAANAINFSIPIPLAAGKKVQVTDNLTGSQAEGGFYGYEL